MPRYVEVILWYVEEEGGCVVFYMRSSSGVHRLMVCALRAAKLRTEKFTSKATFVRTLTFSAPRLILLSVVLPKRSKLRVLGGLGGSSGAGSVPIVVIATGNSRCSGMMKLSSKTSSCIAGPFNVVRLVSEVGTMLEEDKGRRSGAGLSINKVDLSAGGRRMGMSKRGIMLALGRFRLLRGLVHGRKVILAESRLLARV